MKHFCSRLNRTMRNSGRRPYRGRLAQALRTAFRRTDEALLSHCRSKETGNNGRDESSGAAAVVAILMVNFFVLGYRSREAI